jgi:LysM repeat protein
VLEPILLLLLTGLAFAMLGLALERILNPRVISDVPVSASNLKQVRAKAENQRRYSSRSERNKRLVVSVTVVLVVLAIFIQSGSGKTLAGVFMAYFDQSQKPSPKNPDKELITKTPVVTTLSSSPTIPPTEIMSTPATFLTPSPIAILTASPALPEPTLTPIPTDTPPDTYRLQSGEFPYCIARRFNVDPGELLLLSGLSANQTFYAGTVLQIPQTGNRYAGERMQKLHPASYAVSRSNETMYTIACQFGDVDPLAIAEANNLPVDSVLYAGQQLNIP